MDIIELKYIRKRTGAGNMYKCLLTEELDLEFNTKDKFRLCRNSGEPLMRVEYMNKGIADISIEGNASKCIIKKSNLYLGTLDNIPIFKSTKNVNKLFKILESFKGKTLVY